MSETNQIINALMRLQRAGAEDSKATAKLKAAAGMVGRAICDSLPEEAREDMAVLVNADRDAALTFARYVAVGWLDELAHWLEQRAAEAEKATTVLEERAKGEVRP